MSSLKNKEIKFLSNSHYCREMEGNCYVCPKCNSKNSHWVTATRNKDNPGKIVCHLKCDRCNITYQIIIPDIVKNPKLTYQYLTCGCCGAKLPEHIKQYKEFRYFLRPPRTREQLFKINK